MGVRLTMASDAMAGNGRLPLSFRRYPWAPVRDKMQLQASHPIRQIDAAPLHPGLSTIPRDDNFAPCSSKGQVFIDLWQLGRTSHLQTS